MTSWSVVVAETAERDLTAAVSYIKDCLESPRAALHLLDVHDVARIYELWDEGKGPAITRAVFSSGTP